MCLKPRDLPENRGTPRRQRGCRPLVGRHEGLDAVDLTHEAYHWTVWVPSGHRLSARRVQTFRSTQRVPLLAPTSPRAVDLASPTLAVVSLSRTVFLGALLSPIHLSWLHVASTWSFWHTISFAHHLQRRAPLTAKLGKLHPQRLWTCALDPE